MIADVTTGRGPIVRILGPVEVTGRTGSPVGPGGRKQATVLVTLALEAGSWVPTSRLVSLVWPGREPPASAANNLKTYIWQLRKLLGPERIENRSGEYRLSLRTGELDAGVVLSEASWTGEALRSGRLEEIVARVPSALARWRGRPYDEIADSCCSHPMLGRLAEARFTLRETLAEAYLRLGQPADAIELLGAITAEDPLRELAWARLIDALREAGRVREALTAYQSARRALLDELGVEPGPELTAAHQAALSGGRGGTPAGLSTCEWPRPHQLPRATTVRGNGSSVRTLLDAATAAGTAPVLVVSGPAGTGKTAIAVLAGHALAEHYPDGQVYLEAGSLSALEALARLIRSVTGPGLWLPDSLSERAALWRSVSHGKQLLLLLDGVRDTDQLDPLLPGTPEALVLVTSRSRITGIDAGIDSCQEIRLDGSELTPVRAEGTWVA
ncbi:AfsR/SARP family transcriptional regulator [Flindersiella endophytica]